MLMLLATAGATSCAPFAWTLPYAGAVGVPVNTWVHVRTGLSNASDATLELATSGELVPTTPMSHPTEDGG